MKAMIPFALIAVLLASNAGASCGCSPCQEETLATAIAPTMAFDRGADLSLIADPDNSSLSPIVPILILLPALLLARWVVRRRRQLILFKVVGESVKPAPRTPPPRFGRFRGDDVFPKHAALGIG